MSGIPMWQASCFIPGNLAIGGFNRDLTCEMYVTLDKQEMHFIDAVNFTLRVLISKNDATHHREMRKVADEEKKLYTLEQKAKKRHRAASFINDDNTVRLDVLVASMKLQCKFRVEAAKRKVAEKRRIRQSQVNTSESSGGVA